MYLYMCVQPGAAGCRASDVDPAAPPLGAARAVLKCWDVREAEGMTYKEGCRAI